MSNDLREAALHYHRATPAGKLEIAPTKPMATQRDLALAYSPGVLMRVQKLWKTRAKLPS